MTAWDSSAGICFAESSHHLYVTRLLAKLHALVLNSTALTFKPLLSHFVTDYKRHNSRGR